MRCVNLITAQKKIEANSARVIASKALIEFAKAGRFFLYPFQLPHRLRSYKKARKHGS